MTTTLLPDMELTELPDLDAEPTCTITVDDVPCARPAVWRMTMRCRGCGSPLFELVCDEHRRLITDAMAIPSSRDFWVSVCCQAELTPPTWERL